MGLSWGRTLMDHDYEAIINQVMLGDRLIFLPPGRSWLSLVDLQPQKHHDFSGCCTIGPAF